MIGKTIILNKMIFKQYTNYSFSGGRGDRGQNWERSDKILLYDEDTKTFKQTGKLEQKRRMASVGIVNTTDFNCS